MTTRDDRHRAHAALVLALALLCLFAAAVATPAADARKGAGQRGEQRCTPAGIRALHGTARAERKVRCLINGRRLRVGAPRLRYNRCLDRAAERHARDMVRRRYFAHTSHRGGTPLQRARAAGYVPRSGRWSVGENLGWGAGAGATPAPIVRAWMRSPGHRANIMRHGYRDVGVAVVRGAPIRSAGGPRSARATYVVEFGARQQGRRCGAPRSAARPQRRVASQRRPAAKPRRAQARPHRR
jgi:uncharacterized protein YkwD